MNPESLQLTVEDQFQLRRYKDEAEQLGVPELSAIIVNLAGQLIIKDRLLREAIRDKCAAEMSGIRDAVNEA